MKEYRIRGSQARIRYHDFPGSGVPLLVIHGLGCAGSFDYPNVMTQPVLASRRRLVVDLLGAGYSDRPLDADYSVQGHATYLAEFVEDMGLEELVIYGHSLGGAVAIEVSRLCGDRVQHLVLSEANLDPSQPGDASWELAQLAGSDLEGTVATYCDQAAATGNTQWAAALHHWLPQALVAISHSAVCGGTPSWRQQLAQLACPKTFLFGERSLPDDDAARLSQTGIAIGIVPHAGHSMAWENPEGLAQALAATLIEL